MVDIVTESALIDEILGPHQKGLGTGYLGYRNHCFRMLNIGRYLVPDEVARYIATHRLYRAPAPMAC